MEDRIISSLKGLMAYGQNASKQFTKLLIVITKGDMLKFLLFFALGSCL